MNEQFYILLSLLAFGWCILSVILFFKIWGMTSDVKEINKGAAERKTHARR